MSENKKMKTPRGTARARRREDCKGQNSVLTPQTWKAYNRPPETELQAITAAIKS